MDQWAANYEASLGMGPDSIETEMSPEMKKELHEHHKAEMFYWIKEWAKTGSIVQGVLSYQEYCAQAEEFPAHEDDGRWV